MELASKWLSMLSNMGVLATINSCQGIFSLSCWGTPLETAFGNHMEKCMKSIYPRVQLCSVRSCCRYGIELRGFLLCSRDSHDLKF